MLLKGAVTEVDPGYSGTSIMVDCDEVGGGRSLR
jgi:hypothetical protein